MTSLVFETAALSDSIKKANIVAPQSAGSAFDKAAGIVLDIDPTGQSGWTALCRSTNLDIYRMEWLSPIECDGERTRWRLPAQLFTRVISSLPIGSGKTVTLEDGINGQQRFVRVKSGRTTARFNLMDIQYYPVWSAFDESVLTEVKDLGGRIDMVEWAASRKGQPPLSGVHLDGQMAIATDKYRFAAAPLVITGLEEPITVPAGLLSQLLKQTGEVKVAIMGGQFYIMPDPETQMRCVTFGDPFPGTAGIRARMGTHRLAVHKSYLLEILERANAYGASDRDSVLRVFVGASEIAVVMANAEQGILGDAIEIPGEAVHERFEIKFTAGSIIDAVSRCPNEKIHLGYDPSNIRAPFYVDGGSGYQAWVQPRQDVKPKEEV